jgi:hypothetical protein
VENQSVLPFQAVDDDVLAHGKAPQACPQILVAAASDVRKTGQKVEARGNGIDEPVGNLDAATFFGNVIPILSSSASASGATRCAI